MSLSLPQLRLRQLVEDLGPKFAETFRERPDGETVGAVVRLRPSGNRVVGVDTPAGLRRFLVDYGHADEPGDAPTSERGRWCYVVAAPGVSGWVDLLDIEPS